MSRWALLLVLASVPAWPQGGTYEGDPQSTLADTRAEVELRIRFRHLG